VSTATQYNPNVDLNALLLSVGASKTVYALTNPYVEDIKRSLFQSPAYFAQFHEAWTGKQDAAHTSFFKTWIKWSSHMVDFDPDRFPFQYPTAGASEGLRQIIFDYATKKAGPKIVHVFAGEYEGYRAYAEAAGLLVLEHPREQWRDVPSVLARQGGLFFLSQPSAIDGNIWGDCNDFLEQVTAATGYPSVVLDLTYVGATASTGSVGKINATVGCIRNVVFSLSKPFGAYYDRIGGLFSRTEDLGLFGNKWFKNLTSLQLGTALMEDMSVFYMASQYQSTQRQHAQRVGRTLGITLHPSDVYILATAPGCNDAALDTYLRRPAESGQLRFCLTPGMAQRVGFADA